MNARLAAASITAGVALTLTPLTGCADFVRSLLAPQDKGKPEAASASPTPGSSPEAASPQPSAQAKPTPTPQPTTGPGPTPTPQPTLGGGVGEPTTAPTQSGPVGTYNVHVEFDK